MPEQCQLNALVDHIITFAALNSHKGPTYNNEESRSAFEGAIDYCTSSGQIVPPVGGGAPQQKTEEQTKGMEMIIEASYTVEQLSYENIFNFLP